MLTRLIDALRRLFRLLGFDQSAGGTGVPARGIPAAPPRDAPPLDRPGPAPQPMLALPQLMAVAGAFPTPSGAANGFTLGMIQSFAGQAQAFGAPPADKRLLPVPTNQPLMAVIGLSYGGDGTHLALPDLTGRTPVGGQQLGMTGPQTLAMTYLIATAATSGAPLPGMVVAFGGNTVPAGWAKCDGSLLTIPSNVALYQVIGQTFGGNAVTFGLPGLAGFAVIGAGAAPGLPAVALGGHVPEPVPAMGLNYLINVAAAAPPASGTGAFPQSEGWLGQVIAYAGSAPPPGWALCDGALLAAGQYPALFELIGTTYGGAGQSFALPDLRGRILIGA
ncbi:microcystin-dependent protein [Sphingomonas naasensis]|uniref:Phage tail collar domain-containing protein n=1 Tax=Sphingomonas naasensis TaxID=1344951 RepID=A0A4S1W3Z2_9SPHN|nr:tail fiber protein [Sphingomonas naasensis]NIJ19661.1 microcystin-dependent protein [Sphingomonas naasensis]TGX37268.1 hypothetical protein E5A74_20185 [Sphingomonas naasensis]